MIFIYEAWARTFKDIILILNVQRITLGILQSYRGTLMVTHG